MKNLKTRLSILSLCTMCLLTGVYGQITPSADAYTNTAVPATNYGANVLLYVDGATEISYIQFNLASIPASASVSEATLKLYVNGVTTAGTFNVDYITGTWVEKTITANLHPALKSDRHQRNPHHDQQEPIHPHQCDFGGAGLAQRKSGQRRTGAGGQ